MIFDPDGRNLGKLTGEEIAIVEGDKLVAGIVRTIIEMDGK